MKFKINRTSFLPKNIKPYLGPLDRSLMSRDALTAYEKWHGEKRRCMDPKYPHYKDYGGKGLTIDYSTRDFMGWYLYYISKYKGLNPTVGRIDHSIGYRFDNIFIQSNEDNSREAILRNNQHIKTAEAFSQPLLMRDWKTNKLVGEVSSIREASRKFGVSQRLIQFIVRGKYKSSKIVPYRLEYK